MNRNRNVLMDVTPAAPKQELVVEPPPPPEPKPTEREIFKPPQKMSVAEQAAPSEQIPLVNEPVAPVKKPKRKCSPAMLAHLKTAREKARQKKIDMGIIKPKTPPKPREEMPTIPEERPYHPQMPHQASAAVPQAHAPQRQYHQSQQIDYDRIIAGVNSKFSTDENTLAIMEDRIRKEEYEKAKNHYGGLFMEAATKFKKKAQGAYGRTYVTPQSGHPVFGRGTRGIAPSQGGNPFDSCF